MMALAIKLSRLFICLMNRLGRFSRFRRYAMEPLFGVSTKGFNRGEGAIWLFLSPFILWASWLWVSLPVKGLSQ